jgi:enoyl-[acyl-carrier protein] reductase II
MQTDLCRRLGIRAPIIQAPMNWGTDARLVSAVSAAGGLGTLGPNAGTSEPSSDPAVTGERLRRQIAGIRALTDRPFAVNVPIGRGSGRVFSDRAVEVVIEEKVPIVTVATGSPEVYTRRLKDAGIFVMHAVASVRHAQKAESAGVDAVIAEGFDGGGHSGFAELPMSVLVPQVIDRVRIPVVAAGGIVDGRGLAMALVAGAQAIYMGTRFMACTESPIHEKVKQAIVDADDLGTLSWGRTTEIARTLANPFARRFREMELGGASPEALHAFIDDYTPGPNRRVGGLLKGDLDQGEIYVGAGAGMIRQTMPAAEIVASALREAARLIDRASSLPARANSMA